MWSLPLAPNDTWFYKSKPATKLSICRKEIATNFQKTCNGFNKFNSSNLIRQQI